MNEVLKIPMIDCLVQFDLFAGIVLNMDYAKLDKREGYTLFDESDVEKIDEQINNCMGWYIEKFRKVAIENRTPDIEAYFEQEMSNIYQYRRRNSGTTFFTYDNNNINLLEYYEMGWEHAIAGLGDYFDTSNYSIHLWGQIAKKTIDDKYINEEKKQQVYKQLQPHAIGEFALGIAHAWYYGWLKMELAKWKANSHREQQKFASIKNVQSTKKTESNNIKAPHLALFCSLVNACGLITQGFDESKPNYCEKVCKTFNLSYSENVRKAFRVLGDNELKATDKILLKVRELILPMLPEKDAIKINAYINNQTKLYS